MVLSAGGSHGSWQAAALRELAAAGGLDFDSILGFSAGALTGAAYGLGRLDYALERWRAIDGGILRFSPRLFPPSLFSSRPIWESVDFALDEEQAKRSLSRRLIVVSSRVERDRQIYAAFSRDGNKGWDGPLALHLVSSCSVPFVFPPVDLAFRGGRLRTFDGGVPCEEPMSFHELADCRDIIVLEMVRPEEIGRSQSGPLRRLDQRARETVRRLIDQGVFSLKSLKEQPRVFRLTPSKPLDFMMLSFHGRDIRAALDQGRSDAKAFLNRPLDYLQA